MLVMDILNLPTLTTIELAETDDAYHVIAEMKEAPVCCQKCGIVRQHGIKKFGKKKQFYMDLPIHAKRVGIYVLRQRYKCHDCGAAFWEDLPDMDDNHFATKRLVKYVQRESLRRTFVSISEDIGLNEKTIRNIYSAFAKQVDKEYRPATPDWLGIDEIHLIGKARCVITNIKERTIVDMLPDRNKPTIMQFFMRLHGKRNVQYATMDMWVPYRDICRQMLPNATIIIDKFHVLRAANRALDSVRKSVREGLSPKERRRLMHDRFILLKRGRELSEAQLERPR